MDFDKMDALTYFEFLFSDNELRRGFEEYKRQTPKVVLSYLKNKIALEYVGQGYCTLIDYLLDERKTRKKIDVVVLSAIHTVMQEFMGNRVIDYYNSDYVPGIEKRDSKYNYFKTTSISWDSCPCFFDIEMATIMEIREFMKIARYKHVEYINSLRNSAVKQQERAESAAVKNNVKTKVEAEQEISKIIDEVQNEERRKMEDKANEAANSAEAKKETDNKSAGEEQKAEKFNPLSEEALTAFLEKNSIEIKTACEQTVRSNIEETRKQLEVMDKKHDAMCEKTNELQASWVRTMNEFTSNMNDVTDKINNIRDNLYTHLYEWQVSLYPREYRPLALQYVDLYRMVNIDGLIKDETIHQYKNHKDKEEFAPATVEALNNLKRNLTIFLRRFEQALNGLGLYVFIPEENQKFDYSLHTTESGEYPDGDRYISKCIVPGIAKKVNSDKDDVIVPAMVELINQ